MGEKQHLCDVCRKIPITDYFCHGKYPGTVQLGHYQAILAKKNCPFCKLIIESLSVHSEYYWKEGEYPTETCYLGREQGGSSPPVLEVWFTSTTATSPAHISGHFTSVGRILPLRFDEGVDESVGAECQIYGRLVDDQISIPLLQNWIKDCTLNHGDMCNARGTKVDCERFLLLVDVWRMCLVKRDWGSRYLALSYVWGNVDTFSTTKGNIENLQKEGAMFKNIDKIPQVIKDAIEFVRSIGETYLWVDTLSVVQDDAQFKLECIPYMDKIFSQAFITIINLSGSDANSQLPGISAGSRSVTQSTMKLGGLTLVTRLPLLFFAEQNTPWNKRAWTFQEGILSRRKVYLSESQMFWCCSESYSTEDCSLVSDRERGFFGDLSTLTEGNLNERFYIYQRLVKRFAPRQMSYASDSLNAFAGILSVLKEAFAWDFASALPETCFDRSLLWVPMSSVEQRPRNLPSPDSHRMVCTSPTWCWSAWKGHLYWNTWRFDNYVGKEVNVKPSVQKFMIKDGGELRMIGHRSVDDVYLNDVNGESEVDYTRHKPSTQMILYFEARTSELASFKISWPNLSAQLQATFGEDFKKITRLTGVSSWLYDNRGHHCGVIFGLYPPSLSSIQSQCEIVELSRCDQDEITQADVDAYLDHLPPEYPSAAEYYGEIFDAAHYSYKRCWAVNVLLLEWKGRVAERLAIGQIHADAWDKAHQGIKQIALG